MNILLKSLVVHFSFVVLYFSAISSAFAIESESQREAVVAPRSKRFYKSGKKPRRYMSLGGVYSSDYNSKKYQLNSRYLFQDDHFVNEINFEHETNYADKGSGANKQYQVKTSDLYDLTLSSKSRIKDSNNYGVLYHRSIYDELSSYYYDGRVAVGVGRMFFGGNLEWDISASYREVKEYGGKMDFITSWRAKFQITDDLSFLQRVYIFADNESMDNQFRTSLIYRIRNSVSFELRHNFEQRRYEEDNKNRVTNLANRSVTLGIVFDLN